MKLINNYELTITKIMILILFIVHSALFISPAIAEESSPSATPEASESGVLSKLDSMKKEIASRAADLKAKIDKEIGNKAYVGKVSGVSLDTITIESASGSRSVRVNEYTLYQDQTSAKSKKTLTLETLKNDDYLIALGEVDEKKLMTAKKVIKSDPPKITAFSYVFGQISKIESRTLTLRAKSGVEQTISFAANTQIKNDRADGKSDDLGLTKNIIAVLENKEASQSSFIYILPSGGLKTLGESTSSAKPN